MHYPGSEATEEDHRRFDAVARALEGREDVELVLAFGSRARGVARPDSDLDLAVLADPSVDFLDLAYDLGEATGVEIHLADLRQAGYPLLQALVRDAVRVYEGRRHAEAEWRAAALTLVELDRPGWERMSEGFLDHLAETA